MGVNNEGHKRFDKLPLIWKFAIIVATAIIFPILTITVIMSTNIKNEMTARELAAVGRALGQITESINEMIKGQMFSISGIIMNDDTLYEFLTGDYSAGIAQRYIDTLAMKNKISAGYGKIYQDVQIAAVVGKNNAIFNLSLPTYESEALISEVISIKEAARKSGTMVSWYGLRDNIFTKNRQNDIRLDKVVVAAMNIFLPKTGEYAGVQIYAFPERIFYEKYNDTDIAQFGDIFIIDGNGGLISSNHAEYVSGRSVLDPDYVRKIAENPNATLQLDGKLLANRVFGMNLWQVAGELPVSYVTGAVNDAFKGFWVVILWCVIVSMVGYAFLSEKAIRPIKNIIRSVVKFESGDMKPYIEARSTSELGLLEIYHNRMIDRINHHVVHEYELDKQKRQLEYDVLMSQINSHFLSNTLESIVWEARAARAFNAANIASALGRFFRLSSSKGNMFVSVDEEVGHVTAYVEVQKIRYRDKFDFILSVDKESAPDIGRLKTLKILLQPLVENAIAHGLHEADRPITIEVKIYVADGMLVFETIDNGIGMSEADLRVINENMTATVNKNRSIGLKNVRERIKLHFEAEHPYADLIIESQKGRGTRIRLNLPIIFALPEKPV